MTTPGWLFAEEPSGALIAGIVFREHGVEQSIVDR
jgi:hypothetical protein